jgi:hypothetical protein
MISLCTVLAIGKGAAVVLLAAGVAQAIHSHTTSFPYQLRQIKKRHQRQLDRITAAGLKDVDRILQGR